VLYYRSATGQAEYLKDKGVALGMVRNSGYANFIENNTVHYRPGDVMVLYTDGVTEAKNARGDEFGYERLAQLIFEVRERSARQILDYLVDQLYAFSGTDSINDDCTVMIVKFATQQAQPVNSSENPT
jgi:serine phosphatase RsbU (regulator of sigma subunit)